MELVKKINDHCREFIQSRIDQEKEITNKREKTLFKNQNEFLKQKSKYKFPHYYELLEYHEIKSKFSQEELDYNTLHIINKIRGIYKHAQTEKTMLCNANIITSIKLNRFTICITKNTLEANAQWSKRAITDFKKAFPHLKLKELILVCSSKIDTMKNNATHCKTIDAVISKLTQHNTFRVLFICSNDTRIIDILTLLVAYSGLSEEKRLPIHIQWDEAHNREQGIPSKRQLIENILMNPIVEQLTPCTATPSEFYDDTNPLWQEENIEKNAIDYTHTSMIKSTSPEYSSLHDAIRINFEDIEKHSSYSNYDISEFNLDDFKKVDSSYMAFRKKMGKKFRDEGEPEETINTNVEELVQEDIDRRRQLEFSTFMLYEQTQYNMGMNLLDNFYEVPGTSNKIYIPNELNIHIISTPKRIVFTYSLMKYANEKPYRPIAIGLFKGKINVMYKDDTNKTIEIEYADFSEKNSAKEFNEKIEECLKYLAQKVNINVPIIIMGNYIPTGESITFVHYNYGTLRSVVLIPGIDSTPAKEYQALCRGNYMTTKFIEHDPNFIPPEKIICSYKQQIDNALIEEKGNDHRIDEFIANQTESLSLFVPILYHHPENVIGMGDENISIPIKIQIDDMEDETILTLVEIFKKLKRNVEDKTNILKILQQSIRNKTISFMDKTGKFDFERFTLIDVRTYRKKLEDEDIEYTWRFPEYEAHHNQSMPYINAKNHISNSYQCELYACYDRYVNKDGFVNPKQRMWLSYRY